MTIRMSRVVAIVLALLLVAAPGLQAITAARVTVATTATLIYTAATGGSTVLIRNAGSASVFLGPSGVTTAVGFELLAGDAVTLPVGPSDTVYGIVASGTVVVHTLETRR